MVWFVLVSRAKSGFVPFRARSFKLPDGPGHRHGVFTRGEGNKPTGDGEKGLFYRRWAQKGPEMGLFNRKERKDRIEKG